MENNKERVLAYTLAKTISHDELSEISGGTEQFQMCYKRTARVSGNNIINWDTSLDIVVDF